MGVWIPIACGSIPFLSLLASVIVIARSGRKRADGEGNSPLRIGGDIAKNIVLEEQLNRACGGTIHSGYLLAYRGAWFVYFLAVQLYSWFQNFFDAWFFYTGWNFFLLLIFFGLGAFHSAKACLVARSPATNESQGIEVPSVQAPHHASKDTQRRGGEGEAEGEMEELGREGDGEEVGSSVDPEEDPLLEYCSAESVRREADWLGYAQQILYQVCLAEVLLVDSVLWIVLFPMAIRDHTTSQILNFLSYNEHCVNLVAMMGEFFLNSMPFPVFRVAYMALLASVYILYQWALHYLFYFRWPYPFLDNSTPEALFWYTGLTIFHIVCFFICACASTIKYRFFRSPPYW